MAEPVRMVVVPGAEGEIGVMRNHASVLTTVKPGVVRIFRAGADQPQQVFITAGFADIAAENCTVLAEQAENVDDMVESEIEQTISNLDDELGLVESDAEKAQIRRKLSLARARLEAVRTQQAA